MLKLFAWREAYLRDENGATAIEYGLIAAGIALAIAASVFFVGDDLERMFQVVEDNIETAAGQAEGAEAIQ